MRLFLSNLFERHVFSVKSIVLAAAVLGGVACKENPVGRQCFIPTSAADGGVPVTIVGAPALECQSRTCLHVANTTPDLCTGECEADDDCDTSPESPCMGGFVCMVPVVVGNFCCKKLCVCRDYLEGGVVPTAPAACDPAIPANECCNLSGRRENPSMYPVCQI
jgi:hypothetical protein